MRGISLPAERALPRGPLLNFRAELEDMAAMAMADKAQTYAWRAG